MYLPNGSVITADVSYRYFTHPISEYTFFITVFITKNNYRHNWLYRYMFELLYLRQTAHFTAPDLRVHSLSDCKIKKIVIYRLNFKIWSLWFVSVFLKLRLLNISTLLFAYSALVISSRHPLLCFYLPSASIIKYIYPYYHRMRFYIMVTSASSLSALGIDYSTLLPIGTYCLHILLRFCHHGWLSHFFHYLVNLHNLWFFILHIWQKYSEDDYFAPGSPSGMMCFYLHGQFSHFRHYLLNQRDLHLSFILIWKKKLLWDDFALGSTYGWCNAD